MIRFNLKRYLDSRKITMYQLSKISGVRPNTISQWYNDDGADVRSISVDTLNAVCKALNCRIEDIVEYIPD